MSEDRRTAGGHTYGDGTICFNAGFELRRAIARAAQRDRISISEFARRAVRAALEHRSAPSPTGPVHERLDRYDGRGLGRLLARSTMPATGAPTPTKPATEPAEEAHEDS